MTQNCTNCKYSHSFSSENIGPNEVPKNFIICKHTEAKKSVNFVQPDFSCVHHKQEGK